MFVLRPTGHFFVMVYVKPGEMDHVLHMIKPTLSLSPFGFFYMDMSVLPHKSLVRSQMQFVLNIKKELPFCCFQLNLYKKNFLSSENALPVTPTEQLRREAGFGYLPFRLSKGVNIAYSEGTIFASATVFEAKREILDAIQKSETRVIGPNCLGFIHPLTGLNATFASSMAKPGNVGFISQSGTLCTTVLD